MSEQMFFYAVYDHPKDYPDHYVVRRFLITPGKSVPEADIYLQKENLDELRLSLRLLGLFPIGRDKSDDPVIVETWI